MNNVSVILVRIVLGAIGALTLVQKSARSLGVSTLKKSKRMVRLSTSE